MQFTWDTTTFINLILCIAILIFGILGYQRSRNQMVLSVGIAFGLFGFSHLATLLGLKNSLSTLLIVVRTAAYLLVTYALYMAAFQSKK
jgi:hypothetical protein